MTDNVFNSLKFFFIDLSFHKEFPRTEVVQTRNSWGFPVLSSHQTAGAAGHHGAVLDSAPNMGCFCLKLASHSLRHLLVPNTKLCSGPPWAYKILAVHTTSFMSPFWCCLVLFPKTGCCGCHKNILFLSSSSILRVYVLVTSKHVLIVNTYFHLFGVTLNNK